MADLTQVFFERLAARGYEPLLHSVSGIVQWKIEGAGSWSIGIEKGSLTLIPHTTTFDSVMECSKDDFIRMVKGEQNPLTAFLQGRLKVKGNIGLAQVFQRIFPDPEVSAMTNH